MKHFILLLILLLSNFSFAQIGQIETALEKGENENVVAQCEKQLKKTNDKDKILLFTKYLNEAYLNLNYYPEYLEGIKKSISLDKNKVRGSINYYMELANYYHHKKIADSSVYYANKSMRLFLKNKHLTSPDLVYNIYSKYANINRNRGVNNNDLIIPKTTIIEQRISILDKYLDTALTYSRGLYQKEDIYHKKATIYLDYVANNRGDKENIGNGANKYLQNSFIKSNKYYKWIVNNSHNKVKISSAYSLIGLNHHYMNLYKQANNYYQKSLDVLTQKDSIIHLYNYISTLNWKGWNLGVWYKVTGEKTLLDKSINNYRENIKYWNVYYNRNLDPQKGENDGYRVNAISKLSTSLAKKYLITQDSVFLKESFKYSDYTKYTKFNNTDFSIKEVQSKLQNNEVFIQNINTTNPYQELIFIIEKNEVTVIINDEYIFDFPYYRQNELYQFDDIILFKEWSYKLYNSKFRQIDEVLKSKGITNVIISNSDYNAMLNFDLIISDTLSNKWKTQPYLFHRYNFSYALCVRSFIESRNERKSLSPNLGLTIGDFKNDVNLRFSKRLISGLENKYHSKTSDIIYNLKNNNIATIVAHGNSAYGNKNGEIRTSIDNTISTDDIFNMNLSNDFVIITTCNSNASQTNYSEGASGNFSKALRYAGAKSSLSTSWEIDDKSNAFIMEKFFEYLAEGMPKNNALWKAKKDYWNQATQDEYKPLYWSPYILTGNTNPVIIRKKEKYKWVWLGFFLIIPIGYMIWKKKVNN